MNNDDKGTLPMTHVTQPPTGRRRVTSAFAFALATLAGACLTLASPAAQAQGASTYPTRPVRLIVGFAAGAGPDIMARLLAQKLSEGWRGVAVVVDNKPGAGGLIAAGEAAHAAPDGYTLLLGVTGNMIIAPASYSKLPYAIADFAPVSQVVTSDFVLLTNPKLVPAKNVREYVAWATKQPQGIFMGTFGAGTPGHFGAYIFGEGVHIKPEVVHYKNTGDVFTGLISGDVQGVFASIGVAAANVKAGKLAALVNTGAERSSALPDVSTMKEQGYGNLAFTAWFGIVAPAKTPAAVLDKLNESIRAALKSPETRSTLEAAGFSPTGTTRDEFARIIAADTVTWGKAVAASGFKAD